MFYGGIFRCAVEDAPRAPGTTPLKFIPKICFWWQSKKFMGYKNISFFNSPSKNGYKNIFDLTMSVFKSIILFVLLKRLR
jgi:hypothetical protein